MSQSPPARLFKADLHCHTRHSGHAKHLRFLRCRDCYSTPLDVYKTAKRRGMDLVTITDHDSIGGCQELLDRLGDLPDFIMGEEASVFFPQFQHEVHVAIYGLNEAHHREIQRLRPNGEELVAYLRQHELLFVLNHFFHDFADGARVCEFILRMALLFDVFEVRNGSQLREHNLFIVKLLEHYGESFGTGRPIGRVGGSDAHTLRRIGRTYTASPARSKQEFLDDIRAGRSEVFGPHSDHMSLAADIYGVVLRHFPAVFSGANGNFPPAVRAKAAVLTLMTTPFLFTPYFVAIRHSRIERERINLFSQLALGSQPLRFRP
ncbi:MAG TPA: PHP-associated domain-containing protein [Terriglobia bacterium]|nr:PHP-associated domain-containing protein [Terriglobia bacterium]